MAKKLLDIEDVPSFLTNKVKQDLKFKTGNFVWRVTFNIPLDPKTVNSDTMYVTNSQDQKLQTYIRYDVKNEVIEVEPLEPYATTGYYFLNITTRVKSKGGQSLRDPISIKFGFAEGV
ncbi:MAG: Ig-like domain-containing protein [Lachnospiraceae bacterium]|nr:Ig-like domain-containing protein [Lachnospiraceae bacterium]